MRAQIVKEKDLDSAHYSVEPRDANANAKLLARTCCCRFIRTSPMLGAGIKCTRAGRSASPVELLCIVQVYNATGWQPAQP